MVTTVLGKVAVTPKGEWNSTTAYEKLDVVSYNGSSYLSVRTVPAATPLSNTNYWLLLAQKGDTGNGVASIEKTGTSGLTDTYTITYTDGSTSTFTVINGEAATVVLGTVSTGAEGTAVVITNSGDEHNAVLNFTIPRGNTGNGIQGIELTSTSGGVKTYTITFTDGNTFSFDVTDGEVTEERLAEALADYALINGYYEDLVAGGSEQLLSSVYEEDSEPYLFRTSGGSLDIGDREEDTIVGGTVAWNQLAELPTTRTQGGITVTNNNDGSLTINGTATELVNSFAISSTFSSGHVYYFGGIPSNIRIYNQLYKGSSWVKNLNLTEQGRVRKLTDNADADQLRSSQYIAAGTSFSNVTYHPMVFDLTQMFGPTIADYIYSLEQANAGAGVAWFKKLFNKPYYEYDAGTLKSVEGLQSHDMRGFNAWDEEWEVGGINTSGEPATADNRIRSKNFIPVFPNTSYYFKSPSGLYIWAYDADKNYIGRIGSGNLVTGASTTPSNCAYIKFVPNYPSYGTTYNNDICINLSWDGERDGEYEPYKKRSYPLDDFLMLRGIPKLDANNKLYYDGDVYEADGTVTRKYGIVDLGTLTWALWPNYTDVFRVPVLNDMKTVANEAKAPFVQAKYELVQGVDMVSTDKSIAMLHGGYVAIHDSAFTDAASFKAAMSGVMLVYELATPTTEEAEPYQTPQIVDDFGTEEYVTDSIVPVGHVTKYMPNLKAKLEMAPDSPGEGDGDYILRQTNGKNKYVKLIIPTELPTAPSEDGTYHLKLTIANGTATLAWEAE